MTLQTLNSRARFWVPIRPLWSISGAPWCGPCRKLALILEEVAEDLGDKVRIVKVNTDENPHSPGRYGVMSIPTMILFKDGKEVTRLVGVMSRPELRRRIEEAL